MLSGLSLWGIHLERVLLNSVLFVKAESGVICVCVCVWSPKVLCFSKGPECFLFCFCEVPKCFSFVQAQSINLFCSGPECWSFCEGPECWSFVKAKNVVLCVKAQSSEKTSVQLTQTVEPHNEYFSTSFILPFHVLGLHSVLLEAAIVDKNGACWRTGPRATLSVKSYDDSMHRAPPLSRSGPRPLPSPLANTAASSSHPWFGLWARQCRASAFTVFWILLYHPWWIWC